MLSTGLPPTELLCVSLLKLVWSPPPTLQKPSHRQARATLKPWAQCRQSSLSRQWGGRPPWSPSAHHWVTAQVIPSGDPIPTIRTPEAVAFRHTGSWALLRPRGVRICRDEAQLGGRV